MKWREGYEFNRWWYYFRPHYGISLDGIAKLLVADCETLAKVGLCCHFDSVIRPEAERIGAGVAVCG